MLSGRDGTKVAALMTECFTVVLMNRPHRSRKLCWGGVQ